MSSVNKVILIGRLGRDPEIRYAPSGAAVCSFSIATSRSWKDKATGDKKEETEWHRLVAYDRAAEVIGEYMKKGQVHYFEGRLKTRKWEKDGVDHYTTEVVVDTFQLLPKARDGGGSGGQDGSSSRPSRPPAPAAAPRPAPATRPSAPPDDMDDDIPF